MSESIISRGRIAVHAIQAARFAEVGQAVANPYAEGTIAHAAWVEEFEQAKAALDANGVAA